MLEKIDLKTDWFFKNDVSEADLTLNSFDNFLKFDDKLFQRKNKSYVCKKIIIIKEIDREYLWVLDVNNISYQLYVNGFLITKEKEAYLRDKLNISRFLKKGINEFWIITDGHPSDIIQNAYLEVMDKKFLIEYYFYYDEKNWYLDCQLSLSFKGNVQISIYDHEKMILTNLYEKDEKIFGQLPKVLEWTPEIPHLYRLEISLIQDDKMVEHVNEKIGFLFQEYYEDNLLKFSIEDMQLSLDYCDEKGILVTINLYPKNINDSEEILQMVGQFVVQNRHHPAIIAWRIDGDDLEIKQLLKTLINLIDPQRKIM